MGGALFRPGENCWRVDRADRARLIVDADAYFANVRAAMMAARSRIMLIGWDFDARIRIGEEGDGAPETIGEFLLWLVARRPALDIYLLRWDFGAVKALFRGSTPLILARWLTTGRIHVKLDAMHPAGASHHQKIVVIDDAMAFCGGIDMTEGRWDTRDHLDGDPRRIGPNGKPTMPWHDATMALAGPVASALGELARDRWHCATDEKLDPVEPHDGIWPEALSPGFRDIEVAISRTRPDHGGLTPVHEIEQLYLDLIRRAKRFIYAENQYFASRRIGEAIAKRMAEPNPPEIVLVGPVQADGWLEQMAMDNARALLVQEIGTCDPWRRFRIYHPVTSAGDPIYVHAKIMIVDDEVLRVGSSNWNNRSLRLDTECDVTIDHAENAPKIRSIREDLMAEHLACAPARVVEVFAETGSLVETVERLRGEGRSLRPYELPALNDVEETLAENQVLDPENPDELFEPFTSSKLLRRFPGLRWRS